MMKSRNQRQWAIIILQVIIVLFASPSVQAIELSIPTLDGTPSDNLTVPVVVKDFVNVAGTQVRIRYDTLNLIIDSLKAPALNNPTVNIGIVGEVHVIKVDFLNPITLGDGEALFTMYFRIAGDASGDATIEFFDDQYLELVDASAQAMDVAVSSGSVNILPTATDDNDNPLPSRFELYQNYPNPFNPSTTIAYSVDRTGRLTLEIFSIAGQRLELIDLGRKLPGTYTYRYWAGDLPSGVYLYRLSSDNFSSSRTMILLK
ncbi:MAG: T9SS type A sorting domain-containing protein [FCB group bacterium]|nr:T9SS type A sorting domain-containing protein [FCB group bacterium]